MPESSASEPPAPPEPAEPVPAFSIDPGTSARDAYEKFVAKFGEEKVVRLVVPVPADATDAADTVREALVAALADAPAASVYVVLQGTNAAAIVAPVKDLPALADRLGDKAKVQAERRLISADFEQLQERSKSKSQ
jgi:hypothetical protein